MKTIIYQVEVHGGWADVSEEDFETASYKGETVRKLYTTPPAPALRLPVDGLPDNSEESEVYRQGFAMGCACYAKRVIELNATAPQQVKAPKTHDVHGFPEPGCVVNERWRDAIRIAGYPVEE